jgi:tetratricopeptide (TPR) repeat protein
VAADLIGESLGQFRIVAKLGQGGMGVVYRATDERLRRTVALKVLPPGFAADPARRDRFLREARAAAALNHVNIATVHDVGEANGRLYIAMELAPGESLRARLASGALPIADALKVARGIARGLAKAHEKGLVHRDLKPDNIMVDAGLEVKILDFGLAKDVGLGGDSGDANAETATAVTTDGQVLGTPAYMSPEQAASKPVDARSDVFAFGIVLYEMVTGAAPFSAPTTMELLIAIARDAPARVSMRNAAVTPQLEAVIDRCLAKAPEGRYASAHEVLAALDGLGEASATSGPSAPTASRAPPRSNTWVAAVAAIALGAAALAGWSLRAHEGATATLVAPSASAPADARHKGVAMTDHPPPRTNVPEAALAYVKALQDLHDASYGLFLQELTRAVALDAGLAAAHLRLAMGTAGTSYLGVDGPGSYRTAHGLRAQLDERDQMMLRAAEALYAQNPADMAAAAARLDEALQRFPDDAELLYYRGAVAFGEHKPDEALAAFARERALDPTDAAALTGISRFGVSQGDAQLALEAAQRCLDLSPGGTGCVQARRVVHRAQGDCAAVLADARRMVALEPEGTRESSQLVSALAATDAPEEAVLEASARFVAATGPKERPGIEAIQGFWIATLGGDFEAAARHLDDLEHATAANPTPGEPVRPFGEWLQLLRETGDARRASTIARDFLRRLPSYDDPPRRLETLRAVQALVTTGEMTPQDARSRARAVVDAITASGKPRLGAFLGMAPGWQDVGAFYALATDDETTLREIVPGPTEPLPAVDVGSHLKTLRSFSQVVRGVGKALVVSGDVERGLPLLEAASHHLRSHRGELRAGPGALLARLRPREARRRGRRVRRVRARARVLGPREAAVGHRREGTRSNEGARMPRLSGDVRGITAAGFAAMARFGPARAPRRSRPSRRRRPRRRSGRRDRACRSRARSTPRRT